MPTQPNENIVPDHKNEPELLRILAHYSSLVDEAVHFGSRIFEWFFETEQKGDHHFAALGLYRRSLELLDSMSPLIKASRISPCKIILRALFETVLFLEYMTQADFDNRGRDFVLCIKYRELHKLKQHLPTDPAYKQYLSMFRKDKLLHKLQIPNYPDLKKRIDAKNRLLNSPYYSSSQESYLAIKKERNGNAPKWWFNLHGGPKDICDLAEKLGRPAQYELLYREWAGYAHGTGGFEGQIDIVDKAHMEVVQIRLPEYAEFVTQMALDYGLTVMKIMISIYAKNREHDFAVWYRDELRNDFLKLSVKKIIVQKSASDL